jgi:type II secretory pathway pseudopilin PulG
MSSRRSGKEIVGAAPGGSDDGGTLIEIIVAIAIFGLLGSALLGVVLSTNKVTESTRQMTNVNEESRLAMERLTRELRQANAVLDVQLPASATDSTALTFWTDFDGNGTADLNAADPEVLTYRWDPNTGQLTLTANDASGTAVTKPVLAANVTAFTLSLRSSLWQHDLDGDGVTDWSELDASGAPVGNGNGTLDAPELDHLDAVAISMTVLDGPYAQTYQTQVDLRNRNLS